MDNLEAAVGNLSGATPHTDGYTVLVHFDDLQLALSALRAAQLEVQQLRYEAEQAWAVGGASEKLRIKCKEELRTAQAQEVKP